MPKELGVSFGTGVENVFKFVIAEIGEKLHESVAYVFRLLIKLCLCFM